MRRLSSSKLLLLCRSKPTCETAPILPVCETLPTRPVVPVWLTPVIPLDKRDMTASSELALPTPEPAPSIGAPLVAGCYRKRNSNYHLKEKNPVRFFFASVWDSPPQMACANSCKFWHTFERGACWIRGIPAFRELITAFGSFGTCQNTGLPMVSSAFFRLMMPS